MMTEQVDLDALIEAAQEFADSLDVELTEFGNARIHIRRLADALRQERERADEAQKAFYSAFRQAFERGKERDRYRAALSRAEETIAEAREILNRGDSADPSREAYRILSRVPEAGNR